MNNANEAQGRNSGAIPGSATPGSRPANTLQGGECARPRTVREELNAAIERHNRQIAHLITLRDTTPFSVLDMPQPNLAALVWPDQQF